MALTEALIETLLEEMSEGKPLRQWCRENRVSKSAVYVQIEGDPGLQGRIARARKAGWSAIAHRVRQTARGKTADEGGDSAGDVQRDKLIIDTDLKLLAKWDPKRYGEKVALEHSGQVDIRSWLKDAE